MSVNVRDLAGIPSLRQPIRHKITDESQAAAA
jgi:hypothetical protein